MWYVAERYLQCLEKNEAEKLLKNDDENIGKLPVDKPDNLHKPSAVSNGVKQELNVLSAKDNDPIKVENGSLDSSQKDSSNTISSEDEGRPRRSNRVTKGDDCLPRTDDTSEEGKRRRSNRLTRSESLTRESRESPCSKLKVNTEAEKKGRMGRTALTGKRKAISEEKENTEKPQKKRKAAKNIDGAENQTSFEQEKLTTDLQSEPTEASGECNADTNQPQTEHAPDGEDCRENKTESKKEWVPVYLTPFEIRGLEELIERLKSWPTAQKSLPNSIKEPERLLERLEVCMLVYIFFETYSYW